MSPVRFPRLPFSGKRCPQCGYDLRGSRTGQCPECGTSHSVRPRGRRTELDNLATILSHAWFKAALVTFVIHFVAVAYLIIKLFFYTGPYPINPPRPEAVATRNLLEVVAYPVPLLSSILWGAAGGFAWVALSSPRGLLPAPSCKKTGVKRRRRAALAGLRMSPGEKRCGSAC